jgi:PIN domain nuclease of toxin-antitoxin system
MRPLLLDTCAVLRLANGEFKKFSKGAMKALREADILYVSPISEWEISLKWRDGGIDLPMPTRDFMRTLVDAYSHETLRLVSFIVRIFREYDEYKSLLPLATSCHGSGDL